MELRSTSLGAHALPPEHPDAESYLDFALAEVLPAAASLAEAADVFLERGAFDAAQRQRPGAPGLAQPTLEHKEIPELEPRSPAPSDRE